jgi:hypothetical protein
MILDLLILSELAVTFYMGLIFLAVVLAVKGLR